jgi:hypothetical protein
MSYSSNEPRIEQHVDALAGRQLALGVLRLDAARPASQARRRAPALEFFQHLLHLILRPSPSVFGHSRACV